MRTILLFVFALFVCTGVSAQDDKKKETQKKESVTQADQKTAATTGTVAPPPSAGDGANLTPEQQGFTKQTINGKDVYVKESGQMIIYYEPKK
jgi:hypothetical protein